MRRRDPPVLASPWKSDSATIWLPGGVRRGSGRLGRIKGHGSLCGQPRGLSGRGVAIKDGAS